MDEVELREFLRERYPRLVGAVALVIGDAAAAEDAVQEAIVRAWERTERGEQIVALDRWVAAVAMNLSRSRLRRLRVERLAHPKLVATLPVQPSGDRIDVARALADGCTDDCHDARTTGRRCSSPRRALELRRSCTVRGAASAAVNQRVARRRPWL